MYEYEYDLAEISFMFRSSVALSASYLWHLFKRTALLSKQKKRTARCYPEQSIESHQRNWLLVPVASSAENWAQTASQNRIRKQVRHILSFIVAWWTLLHYCIVCLSSKRRRLL